MCRFLKAKPDDPKHDAHGALAQIFYSHTQHSNDTDVFYAADFG